MAVSHPVVRTSASSIFGPIGPAYADSVYGFIAACSIVIFTVLLTAPVLYAIRWGEKWLEIPQWIWGLLVIVVVVDGVVALSMLAVQAMVIAL